MATRLTHELGDVLAQRFEVREVLGHGAHGTVYRCADRESDGAACAVKEMHWFADPQLVADGLERWQRECDLLARGASALPRGERLVVDGPFRVAPLTGGPASADCADAVTVAQRFYLVLPLLDGLTLEQQARRAVETAAPLPVATVLRWVREVGATLTWLHARGLVHRDVKPRNIVTDAHGAATLIDFGLTRAEREVPGYGTVPLSQSGWFGTPGYAPPDPVEQEEPTAASDQFALAMTARRVLTGLDPGDASQLPDLLGRPLLELRSDVPHYQAAALDRAVRYAASDRFDSVEALLDALARPPAALDTSRRTSWIELQPAVLNLQPLGPGEVRDISLVIRDRRSGIKPEGHAVSEDPCLRILPPRMRGNDVVLHLVLRVPRNAAPGPVETMLTVVANDEEHLVPVHYTVDKARATGCLLGLVSAWF